MSDIDAIRRDASDADAGSVVGAYHLASLVPALCDEVERLRAELADANAEVRSVTNQLTHTVNDLAKVRRQAHRDATNHQQIVRANTDLANERDEFRAAALLYAAKAADLSNHLAVVRALCDQYKDAPPPIFRGPDLSEHGKGYSAGTRDMARAVLGTLTEVTS